LTMNIHLHKLTHPIGDLGHELRRGEWVITSTRKR
jgi:hypothetical protein